MNCPVCGGGSAEIFFEQRDALVFCNRPARTHAEALAAPRADLRLVLCDSCSHIYNTAFDPERVAYAGGYENSLHFSETFGRYARELAAMLVDRFDLHGKRVVEIGCGDGTFLRSLCELGGNRGVGFDPAATPTSGDIEIVAASYTTAHVDVAADFVCCRHVLEHQSEPRVFLEELKPLLLRRSASYYFEVPNAVKTFYDGLVWDVLYEHFSYFTPRSLQALFASADLGIAALDAVFDGQFLALQGPMATTSPQTATVQPSDLRERALGFAQRRAGEVERWRSRLADLRSAGRTVAVWGAGSKGVTFLDAVGAESVAAVVDMNPRKQGSWVAGCGLEVVAPSTLCAVRPHNVVVMNPVYCDEVGACLDALGLTPEVVGV